MTNLSSQLKRISTTIFIVLNAFFIQAQTYSVIDRPEMKFTEAQSNIKFVGNNGEYYCVTFHRNNLQAASLYSFRNNSWEKIDTTIGSSQFTPMDIVVHDNKFYILGQEGIIIKDGSSYSSIDQSTSNLPSQLHKIYVDDDIMIVVSNDSLSYKLSSQTNFTNIAIAPFVNSSQSLLLSHSDNPIYNNGKIHYDGSIYDITTKTLSKTSKAFVSYNRIGAEILFTARDAYPKVYRNDTFYYLGNAGFCAINVRMPSYISYNGESIFNDKNGNVLYLNYESYDPLALNIISTNSYYHGLELPFDWNLGIKLCYDQTTDTLYELSSGKAFKVSDYITAAINDIEERTHLDVNNVSTPVKNDGTLFFDYRGREDNYRVPKEDCKSPLFAGGLWIGGQDDTAGLHLAAMTYRQRGTDFWPGPLDENDGSFNPQDSITYNRVWKVNKSEVNDHIKRFNSNGSVNPNEIPESILNWPGNRTSGSQLAPYFDQNSNGIYEPDSGDYPKVPGDQCVYWVMNDLASVHGETGGMPLGVEVHCFAYAYYCPTLSTADPDYVLNNTTFYKFLVVNRSENDYFNSVMSIWTDNDIGYYGDDYVGCHVLQNFGYAYNGDAYDEKGMGYGENPPMQSNLFLKAPGMKHDGIDGDNDGTMDEDDEIRTLGRFIYYNNNTNPINGNPNQAIQFYNYQRANWMNGTDVQYGGDGITSTNGTRADYMFPGLTDPDHPNENWTESTSGNIPADRRFVSSSYDFDFASGDSVELEIAMVYTHDPSQYDQMPLHLSSIATIKDWYYNGGNPSCFHPVSVDELDKEEVLSVYPVPSYDKIKVTASCNITEVKVISIRGEELLHFDANSKSLELPIHNLLKGVYIIQVSTDKGVLSKKILKL